MSGLSGSGKGSGSSRCSPPTIEEEANSDSESETGSEESGSTPPSNEILNLVPGKLWLDKPKVVRKVTQAVRAGYKYPYLNWRETPLHVRDAWWNLFKIRQMIYESGLTK
ncbi:hypothetical protein RND81_11G039100 [Saponaria officinalis]|uniref:Uncharacterized protein n=1 Tax=Saponaria officinalis TaxID=3572 RepID=A0AAW1HHW9_SAPOF